MGCTTHAVHDCGCPGYPNLQTALRDCGGLCQIIPHPDRCIRCQAARLIDTLQNRNARYLDRILHLQDTLESIQTTIHRTTGTNDRDQL